MSSDLNILGGVLGLGNPVYDPSAAQGYLTELRDRQKAADTEYNDVLQRRRAKVADMSRIVDEATRALVATRTGRVNLPMMSAAAGMLAPTRTGSFGESIGNALGAAVPTLQADRTSEDQNILRTTNLKSLPITMGEGIDKDEAAQIAQRGNTLLAQRSAVERGVLNAQSSGMKLVMKQDAELRKIAAANAKAQMQAAQKAGVMYNADDTEVMRQLQEAEYAKLFKQAYGVWPTQAPGGTHANKTFTDEDAKEMYKLPERIEMEKKEEREYYAAVSSAGQAAQNNLSALNFAQPPPGTQVPGLLAPIAVTAARIAEAFGLGGKWGQQIQNAATDVGKMKAVLQGFVLDMQQQQKGVQTEGDAQRMANVIANITNPEELNIVMFNWMKSQQLGAMYRAELADKYVAGRRNSASGIRNYLGDNDRFDLSRTATNGKRVTLWEFYNGYKDRNPNLGGDELLKQAIEAWKTLK
jgi:hypothetical protein